MAVELARKGRYDRAGQLLSGAAGVQPKDTLRYNLAQTELAQRRPDQAARWLQGSLPFPNAGLQRGLAEAQRGRYNEALNYFRTTPVDGTNNTALFYNQALALWRSAKLPDAYPHIENYLQQGANNASGDARPRMALGQLYAAQNRWDEALRQFEQARTDSADIRVYLYLGEARLALRQEDEAIGHFREYLEKGGREGYLAHLGMAQTYYRQGHYAQALESYQRVQRIKPGSAEAAAGIGHVLLAQQLDARALIQYQRAVGYDTAYAPARLGRAMALYRLGRYAEAWKDFQSSAHLINPSNPDFADFYLCRGFTLLSLKKYALAIPEFENAMKTKPRETAVYAGLSEAYRGTGDFASAHRNINEALKFQPDNPRLLTNRGNFQLNIQQFDDAADDFRRAIRLNPLELNAHNGLAITDLEGDRIGEALVRYDSLIMKYPKVAMIFNNRGVAQSYKGLQAEFDKKDNDAKNYYAKSLADFQRAAKLDTSTGYFRNNMGNVYRLINEKEKAIGSYESYLSKTSINNLGALYAANKQPQYAHYYITTALRLDSVNSSFLFNRARMYRQLFPDSLQRRASYLRAENYVSPNAISRKYSKDGYITIYLFDYQYNPYPFPGNPRFPLSVDTGKPQEWMMYPDFQAIPEPPAPEPVRTEPRIYTGPKGKPLKSRRPSPRRGSTECPAG